MMSFRGMNGGVCSERIVTRGRGMRRFQGPLFLGLLALRNYFEPGTSGTNQYVQRCCVQASTVSTSIGINQCGDFIFQQQRKDHRATVCRSAKLCGEMRVNLGGATAFGVARLHYPSGQPGAYVQRKIFDGVVMRKRRSLPAGGGSGLDHEESGAFAVEHG